MAHSSLLQIPQFADCASFEQIRDLILKVLGSRGQPSAWELVSTVEEALGWKSRWSVKPTIEKMIEPPTGKNSWRNYLESLVRSGDLDDALRGVDAPRKEIVSSLDALLSHTKIYQCSDQFREMVGFMANFKDYAPYNNMLVRIQDPTCSFYATAHDWNARFKRSLKEDARPMLILAPMHPVMLVYSLDQTEGPDLPDELNRFARFAGEWNPDWLRHAIGNAEKHDHVRVTFKMLSCTNAGFATLARGNGDWKMRIAIHEGLDSPSRFGVLCHELAHIYLGHLGTDRDHW